ncbi:hypothetical protein [Nocardia sp. GAS34]|uniref:hypothetical protein n=1 Tax=unclassified Nocardia TaxID=2637762 RepID=UPI003D206AF2
MDNLLPRLYRTRAVPREFRDGPITQLYGARGEQDLAAARHLREVQNLAAMITGAIGGAVMDESPAVRQRILTQALEQARRAALAAAVPAWDIEVAAEHGSRGVPWVQAPAHRYLGRIEQLTDELAAAQQESAYLYDAVIESYEREQNAEHDNAILRARLAEITTPAADTAVPTRTENLTAAALSVVPDASGITDDRDGPGQSRSCGEPIADAIAATTLATDTTLWNSGSESPPTQLRPPTQPGREVER